MNLDLLLIIIMILDVIIIVGLYVGSYVVYVILGLKRDNSINKNSKINSLQEEILKNTEKYNIEKVRYIITEPNGDVIETGEIPKESNNDKERK